jgi:hypothetical protein
VNPIHEIHYFPNMWAPSTGWKDCRCEVTKVAAAATQSGSSAPVSEEVTLG